MKQRSIYLLIWLLLVLNPYLLSGQEKMDKLHVKALIDSLTVTLNNYYVFPDQAKAITTHIQNRFKKNSYEGISDPAKLVDLLQDDIRSVHVDPHMRMAYNKDFLGVKSGSNGPSEEEIKKMDEEDRESNYLFHKVEILKGNIGYVRFDGFVGNIEAAKATIKASFGFLVHTRAVIIDLRFNGGGSPEMVSYIESFFFDKKTHMNDIIDRLSNDTTYFYADPLKSGGLTLLTPIYILTSKRTFSGAEDFSYGMQSVNRATIVGETTGGGAHPTRPFVLGQGFVIYVPFARSLNPYTKTDWEGTGVKPDIPVSSEDALIKAQETILTSFLTKEDDEQGKRKLRWALNDLIAGKEMNKVSSNVLNRFVGTYHGGLKFYIENELFFCKNGERGNNVYQLKPISETLFVLDENAQVEFMKDNTGNYSQIQLLFQNGKVIEKDRIMEH